MLNEDLFPFEQWKDVPDMKFHYQVSNLGRVKHIYPSGKERILHQCYSKTLAGWIVGLTKADGKYTKMQVITLMSNVWLGKCPKGYQRIHKNGVISDNRLENVITIKRSDIGKVTNKQKRKPVMKIDRHGEIVEFYKSAKECADKNHYQYSTIKRRCSGDFKSLFGSDGFEYCYEDDEKRFIEIIQAIERGCV